MNDAGEDDSDIFVVAESARLRLREAERRQHDSSAAIQYVKCFRILMGKGFSSKLRTSTYVRIHFRAVVANIGQQLNTINRIASESTSVDDDTFVSTPTVTTYDSMSNNYQQQQTSTADAIVRHPMTLADILSGFGQHRSYFADPTISHHQRQVRLSDFFATEDNRFDTDQQQQIDNEHRIAHAELVRPVIDTIDIDSRPSSDSPIFDDDERTSSVMVASTSRRPFHQSYAARAHPYARQSIFNER